MLAYNFKIYNCVLEHFSDSLFERTLFEGNLIKRYIAGFGLFSHAFAGFGLFSHAFAGFRYFSHAFAGFKTFQSCLCRLRDFSVTSFLASRLFSHALSGRLLARVLQDGSSFLPESFQGGGIEFPILWPIA